MLRYYDETGLLKPAETDNVTGYRLYSADQISNLNKIKFLRDLGFNVSEISVALNKWENEFIIKLLENKRHEIEHTITTEQDKLSKIELAKKDIFQEKISIHYNVSIKTIPAYQVFSLRRVVYDYSGEGELWKEMSAYIEKNKIPVSNSKFSIFHDTEYRENNVDIEICASVAVMGDAADVFTYRITEPVPIMASTMINGSFDNIAGASIAFAQWLQEQNKYEMYGQCRQIVHRGPWNEENPDNYLTEIQIPLVKK
jgi:DNA-binding transcriptional MerR regulator/effector-binding domain-containing protein